VRRADIHLVEITGGEPLLQKDVFHLVKKLLDEGYKVLIETNGSVSIKDIDARAVIILDIKTPGSGMSEKMDFSNISYLKDSDEIKFVMTGKEDYDWTKEMIKKYDLINKCGILFSPAYGILSPHELAVWMIKDKIKARLNLQIHKYIFGHNMRGV
jgi:7-carboxy-7-deazaguanine synthase